jgi:autotransporter-associated beta strand protein
VNTARTIGHIVFNEPANANDMTLRKHVNDYILTLDLTNGTPTAPTINVTQANRTFTIFPRVGGTDGLAKTGPGTLVLSNANLYTGPTKIQAGILTLGDSLAIQNSVLDTASSGAVAARWTSQSSLLMFRCQRYTVTAPAGYPAADGWQDCCRHGCAGHRGVRRRPVPADGLPGGACDRHQCLCPRVR